MTKATIDVWQAKPLPPDEEPGFLYYKMAGTCDGQPWCATIGIEVDGRDAEYEHHWGVSMECVPDSDRWDALLVALDDCPDLTEDMRQKTAAYYGE